MINNNCIYSNKKIPSNFYYARLRRVETEKSNYEFPKVMAEIEILPQQGVRKGTVLYALIYPSAKAAKHFINFKNTFPVWDNKINAPKTGQIGSVWIYDSEYDGTRYSAVKFVYQSEKVRRKIRERYGGLGERE